MYMRNVCLWGYTVCNVWYTRIYTCTNLKSIWVISQRVNQLKILKCSSKNQIFLSRNVWGKHIYCKDIKIWDNWGTLWICTDKHTETYNKTKGTYTNCKVTIEFRHFICICRTLSVVVLSLLCQSFGFSKFFISANGVVISCSHWKSTPCTRFKGHHSFH